MAATRQNRSWPAAGAPVAQRGLVAAALAVALCSAVPAVAADPSSFMQPTENLSESLTASVLNQVTPQAIALDGDRPTVIWSEIGPGDQPELMARRASAAGWDTPPWRPGRSDTVYSGDAAIAIDASGRAQIVWIEARPGRFEVRAGELPPTPDVPLVGTVLTAGPGLVFDPTIATGEDGEIFAAWTEKLGGTYEVRAARWTRHGGWAAPEIVSPDDQRPSTQAHLAVGPDNRLHLVWSDRRPEGRVILYRWNAGGRWSAPRAIGEHPEASDQGRPVVDVEPAGHLHFVWQEARAQESAIYATSWTLGAAEPEPPRRVAGEQGPARAPQMAVDASGVAHLVWEDARPRTPGGPVELHIVYARVEHGAVVGERRLSRDDAPLNMAPSIAVDAGGGVHVVWQMQLAGAGEIVYRRGGLKFVPGSGGIHHD